jgi:hypothetical protein
MSVLATLSHSTSLRLAEIAFLLILVAGVWIVASEIQLVRWHRFRMIVAGSCFAVSGILLIIAAHWGQFG